jgi:hypothetical protein
MQWRTSLQGLRYNREMHGLQLTCAMTLVIQCFFV